MKDREFSKNIMFFIIVFIIVFYVASYTYGIIRDWLEVSDTSFVISANISSMNGGEAYNIKNNPFYKIFFASKGEEVAVTPMPAGKVIIRGLVRYENGTPYKNGLVKLQSKPRFTYTNELGVFEFRDVEMGAHTISIVENAKTVASCYINLKSNILIKDIEILAMEEGKYIIEIGVHVPLIEIVLDINEDIVDVKLSPDPLTEIPETPIEIPIDPVIPEVPKEPTPPSPIVDEEEDDIPPIIRPKDYKISITDEEGDYEENSMGTRSINIFGKNKYIAPGMTGIYTFTIDNRQNAYNIDYDITFTEINDKNIPMEFRLKKNDKLLSNNFGGVSTISIEQQELLSMKTDRYILEWSFKEGQKTNDNDWIQQAGDAYTIKINIFATQKIKPEETVNP